LTDFAGTALRSTTATVQGIATSVVSAGKTLTVVVNGTEITARALRDVTVAVGDIVLLQRHQGQLLAIGRMFAAAPAADDPLQSVPPPAPKPPTVTGTLVIAPVETRSYRASLGWRTDNDDVYQGEYGSNGNHTGCAFYGSKPRSLKGATVTSASIRAKRVSGGDYAARTTTLRRITNRTKPGGAPTLVAGSTNGPRLAVGKSDTTISIPTGWAQDLVDGNAGGLAILDSSGSPYVRLAGRGTWAQSFTLTIKWKRTS
jgi:hypothetical protein